MKVLTAFCDLQFCPVSYDFVTWLSIASFERDQRGCDGLHVVVVPLEGGLGNFARHWGKHDEAATRWRLWHIVVASCPLAGATVTLAANRRQAEEMRDGSSWWPAGKSHFMGVLVQASRAGKKIPLLNATEAARRHIEAWIAGMEKRRGVVTLTIRDQTTDPARNSDPAAWGAFARWLEAEGWEVICLLDTPKALNMGRGYAELDPDLRLALYEQASMNMIGNNGPQELLEFSSAPYRAMGQALTDGWKDHFRRYFKLEPGEQFPWALPNQRLVYKPDTFENLRAAFET